LGFDDQGLDAIIGGGSAEGGPEITDSGSAFLLNEWDGDFHRSGFWNIAREGENKGGIAQDGGRLAREEAAEG
jgi:hypothetical protein